MALAHDGTNDYVVVANESAFDFTRSTAHSIFMYINPGATQFQSYISKLNLTSPFPGWEFAQDDIDTNDFTYQLASAAANKMRKRSSGVNMANGTWYNLGMTYNGGGSNNAAGLFLYVNGARPTESTVNDTLTVDTTVNNDSPTIGARVDFSADFNGRSGYCVIWNVAITANNALALGHGVNPFVIENGSQLMNLALYDASATQADFKAQAHQGTLTGATKYAGNPPMEHLSNYISGYC